MWVTSQKHFLFCLSLRLKGKDSSSKDFQPFSDLGLYSLVPLLSVCFWINTVEGQLSREERKQHPSLFWTERYKWFNNTWSQKSFLIGVTLLSFILLSWTCFAQWDCGTLWYLYWPTKKNRQIWEQGTANKLGNRPDWGGDAVSCRSRA